MRRAVRSSALAGVVLGLTAQAAVAGGVYYFQGATTDPVVALYQYVKPVEAQVPAQDGVFWAHQFWMVNGVSSYVGMQNLGNVGDGSPNRKIGIFSVWNATGGQCVSGYLLRFTNEGEGYSCRVPLDWQVNSEYGYQVTDDGARLCAAIFDYAFNVWRYIGCLNTPADLHRHSITWTEHYGGPTPCPGGRHQVVWQHNFVFKNGAWLPPKLPDNATDPGAAHCNDARNLRLPVAGGFVVQQGIGPGLSY